MKDTIVYIKYNNSYTTTTPEWKDDKLVLPEYATTTPPPEPMEGFQLTITKDGEWEEVKTTIESNVEIEALRGFKVIEFENWENRFLNSPFIYDGDIYLGDAQFRDMIKSAIMAYNEWNGRLPKMWFTATGNIITPVTKEFLDGLGEAGYDVFETQMNEAIMIRIKLETLNSVYELENLTFPEVPTVESLLEELTK